MADQRSRSDNEPTWQDDEIVAEVRATRARLSAAAGYDLDRLWSQWEQLEAEERMLGHAVMPPPAGEPRKPGAVA